VSLPEAIRDEFLWQSRSVVIAGTHGKTTTTALAGWLLTACGQEPSLLVGGIAMNFDGSYRLGSGRDFVIEGDEYDSAFFDKTAKFLKYLPDIAVVGNLEYDHADIYADLEALRVAFRRFVNLIPRTGRLILGAESAEAARLATFARCPVETFGVDVDADWRASAVQPDGGRITFDLTVKGEPRGPVSVPLWGAHNVRNTLAAMAVGAATGLDVDDMARALAGFKGVRRRLELRGVVRDVSVFDDFAHHPTAIFETLRAVRWSYPDRRVWAIFEPRSATSCRRIFQDDFTRAFAESGADEVILASVFRASLPEHERLSVDEIVERLRAAGRRARHIATVPEIVRTVATEAGAGDVVVIMSNGGFDGIHDKLLAALGA
jgi:UDP-N-acetylmuramate: L-alanyl-gamma-D-glutamyl-meso-diaminopimelate ligase